MFYKSVIAWLYNSPVSRTSCRWTVTSTPTIRVDSSQNNTATTARWDALFNFVFADTLFILHDYTLTQFFPKLIPFLYFDIFFFRCAHYSQSAFLFITCFIVISSFGYWILQSPPLYNTNDYILQSETSLSYIRFNWSGPSSY